MGSHGRWNSVLPRLAGVGDGHVSCGRLLSPHAGLSKGRTGWIDRTDKTGRRLSAGKYCRGPRVRNDQKVHSVLADLSRIAEGAGNALTSVKACRPYSRRPLSSRPGQMQQPWKNASWPDQIPTAKRRNRNLIADDLSDKLNLLFPNNYSLFSKGEIHG